MMKMEGGARQFVQHYLEMVLSMAAGMAVFGILFVSPLDPIGYRETLRAHPYLSELLMLLFMTASMVGFMAYRGHSRRMILEMTAGMTVPVLPVIALASANTLPFLTDRALSLWTHAGMLLGMLAVMLFRRADYAGPHRHAHGGHSRT